MHEKKSFFAGASENGLVASSFQTHYESVRRLPVVFDDQDSAEFRLILHSNLHNDDFLGLPSGQGDGL
jgi:hypothetical protein